MSVTPPDDTLRDALRRLGANGARAEQFLASAAAQLGRDEPLAGHHAAYAIREALMAILELGGKVPRGIKDAAKDVVRRWDIGQRGDELGPSIRELAQILAGPGPHDRRLERAVTELSRVAPTRDTADLLNAFLSALDEANGGVHAATPPDPDAVADLYGRASRVLRDLFGPISHRLVALDDLAAIASPGPADVARLRQRLGDDRHLNYFFDKAAGPGWFRALRDDRSGTVSLLLPPADGPWPAWPYITRAAESDPDEVRAWLAALPADLNGIQVAELVQVARAVGSGVAPAVGCFARRRFADPGVLFQIDALLRAMPEAERDTAPARRLVQNLLAQTLGAGSGTLDTYMAREQLLSVVMVAGGDDAAAWLTMLAHRVKDAALAAEPMRLRLLPPLAQLHIETARHPVEMATAALIRAVAAAAPRIPLGDRLAILRIVPEPLAGRLVALHLAGHLPEAAPQAVAFLGREIATSDSPSPEALTLLRILFKDPPPDLAANVEEALGPVPDEPDPPTDAAIRAHRWLVAIPADVAPAWQAADCAITELRGPASEDGVLIGPVVTRWGGDSSPIAADELAALAPLDAAARVAAWRPDPDQSFFAPSAEGLVATLRRAIDADLDRWLAADPVAVASALHHPIYISVYLQTLTDNAARLSGSVEPIVSLVELVRTAPWPVQNIGRHWLEPEQQWPAAGVQAIELLARLGETNALRDDADADARAWAQIVAAIGTSAAQSPGTDDDQVHDPLTAAVNRPSMMALEAAIAAGLPTLADAPDDRLLALLDELLARNGIDGLHVRAMLARPLALLRDKAPKWFADHADRIFGDAAPDKLGPTTVDLYLEWGLVYDPLLEEQRGRIVEALVRDHYEKAIEFLIVGLLRGVPGYDVATVADALVAAGADRVSEAGRWMGWGLAEALDDLDVGRVVELWRQLIVRDLDPSAYAGFGWLAINEQVGEDVWLSLTSATLAHTGGDLDEPDRVAVRAARAPADPRAAAIVTLLLEGDPSPWNLQRIGAVGLELLPQATGAPATALRERLLERGFHEALDL